MAIKVNTWKPDTCGCEIEFEWDDSVSSDQRTHTVRNIINPCPAHQGLIKEEHFDTVLVENKNKNKAINKILEIDSSLENKDIIYSFDDKRNLNISFLKSSAVSKEALMTELVKISDKVKVI